MELDYPALSVFSSATYPPPSSSASPTELLSLVHKWASRRPSWTNQLAYVDGGAAGDPAALGVGWLVAAAFADESTKETYMSEAEQELDYLLNSVPRTSDGAISHRPPGEPVSLWADFISMVCRPVYSAVASLTCFQSQVPPFLAYYGVATQNRSLVLEAYDQITLYRSYLRTSSGSWKHVVQGDFTDAGLWSTGNGWVAHGIARVLATVQKSQWNETLASEAADLGSWGVEIVKAAFENVKVRPLSSACVLHRLTSDCLPQSDGLLPNYYDSASGSSFSDASGSALLAAAAYRLAKLGVLTDESVIKQAAAMRTAVSGKVDTSSGWVAPVVVSTMGSSRLASDC